MQASIILAAGDPGAAARFYERIGLGLDRPRRGRGPRASYRVARIRLEPAAAVPVSVRGRLVLLVNDLGEALAAVEAGGGSVVAQPLRCGAHSIAIIADPDGNGSGGADG